MSYSTRTMTPQDWAAIRYFKPHEFRAPERMGWEFMLWLNEVRHVYGHPIPARAMGTWRSPARNAEVGGVDDSAHTKTPCEAIDIMGLDSTRRFKLVRTALAMGCRRIGVYENGTVHLDLDPDKPQDVLWVSV